MEYIINGPTRVLLGTVEHDVKVTHINGGWNVRVYTNGEVSQEMRVTDRTDVGKAAREMLRWEAKCGNVSDLANNARRTV